MNYIAVTIMCNIKVTETIPTAIIWISILLKDFCG